MRKIFLISISFISTLLLAPGFCSAQNDTLRIMVQNTLHFGDGCQGTLDFLNSQLEKEVNYVNPDLLGLDKMQAIKLNNSDTYGISPTWFADSVIWGALNVAYPGRYAYCTLTDYSKANDNDMSVLFYNTNKLGFLTVKALYVGQEDIDLYKLYYKDPYLNTTHDTTLLYVVLCHTISGNSSSGRDGQATTVVDSLQKLFTNLPNLIYMGDFNLHNTTEPGYELLTQTTDTSFLFDDPPFYPDNKLSYPINWANTPSAAAAELTVTTRQSTSVPNSCGSNGGGAFEWYDHILLSRSIVNNYNYIRYLSNSWKAVGNDGNRLGISVNDTVTNGKNLSAPYSVLNAEWEFSDKYPVTVKLGITYHAPPCLLTSVTSTTINPLCHGATGSATAIPSGGVLPYTYSWNNGQTNTTATGLTAGNYTVHVTDNKGCTGSASVTITQPAAVSVTIASHVNVSCSLGSATANAATGGTPPYTYAWTPAGGTNLTASNLSAGTYTITAKDINGCNGSASVIISSTSTLRDSLVTMGAPSCFGGSNGTATVGVKGGTSPYTYAWTGGGGTSATSNVLEAQSYTVTVTDKNGCTQPVVFTLTQPLALRDSLSAGLGPKTVIHYWDFNNTLPAKGAGGDSLGTSKYPLPAQYSLLSSANPKIVQTRPSAKQTSPLACTLRDSIMDNDDGGAYINDLKLLGNDSAGGNLFIKACNPSENAFTYLYLPTTGYSNIMLDYAISASSSKGAYYNIFSYSTNGGTAWNKLTKAMDTFNIHSVYRPDTLQVINPTTSDSKWYAIHIDFSSDENVNNNPNFILRWEYEGTGSNGTSGNDRYDNISLSGNGGGDMCVNNLTNATIGVKGGTSPYTYLWSPGGGTNATMTGLSNGSYTITVTDKHGCSATTGQTFNCSGDGALYRDGDTTTGVSNCCPLNNEISIYPNPTNSQFTVSGLDKGMFIEIYDYTGRRVSAILASDITMHFNLSNQSNGIYFVRIISKEGTLVSSKKVVKIQ